MSTEQTGRLTRDGIDLAWSLLPGTGPTIVFLPGFKSDMEGSKATHLRDWAATQGRAMLRFDYAGHGASGGMGLHMATSVTRATHSGCSTATWLIRKSGMLPLRSTAVT